jgi:hypothetical protein
VQDHKPERQVLVLDLTDDHLGDQRPSRMSAAWWPLAR